MLCIVSALGLSAQTWTASDLAEGKYVFQNVATGRYLGPSNSWGTQASLLEASHFNTLHNLGDGVYTIESQVSNGGSNYFLNGSFMDGAASNFTIQDNGEGVFTISRDGSTYYGYDGSSNVVATNLADPNSANAQWKIMAYDEVYADASEENPVDVTYMILCSNFDRNHRSASAWTMESSNQNLCGGKNENKCAESYRAAFTLSQTISVPDGYYKVRAQAALTEYDVTGADFPVVYATSGASMVTRPFNTMKNGEASMNAMSDQFASGNYWTEYTDVIAVVNGSLTVGVKGTRTNTWCIWDNFQLMYMGPLPLSVYKEEFDKVVASAKTVKGTVPAAVYANIESVINEKDKAYESKEEYSAAATAITDAVNTNATAQIVAAYAHYNKKKAAALAVDDDTDAYEGDARVDVSEADAEVEAATTVEEIQAAEPLIEPAVSAFLESVTLKSGYRFDITDVYLENADFEVPTKNGVLPPGWDITITGQNCGQQNRTDKNPTEDTSDPDFGRSITNFIEAWHPSQLGSGVIAQTVKALPEGVYVLEVDASICHDPAGADDITGAGLFIKSSLKTERQAISNVRLYIKHYSLDFVHGGDGEVQFGLEANNTNANWLSADNFKVYYAGPMPLEVYEEMLGETLTAAQDYDKEVPQAAIDALMDVVDDNDKSWSSKDEYRAAIAAINAAVEATDALVAPYADYKALVKECETLQAIDNDNEAANATFQAAIESEAIEDCETLEDIAAVKAALAQARLTYVAEANPAGDAKFDLSFMLTNPNLEGLPTWAKAEGWYTEQTEGNSQVMVNDNATSEDGTKKAFFEYWKNPAADNNLFALYQKVTLPAGTYNMSCYAFAQDDGTHINHPNGVYFYANDVQGSAVNNARLSQAQIEFVNATEQEVKIGLKTVTGNVNFWMGIGYVELYKIAPKTIEIAENVDFEPVAAAGDVTLTRTIKADTWNTFVVPFQITNDELKVAFGDDVEVAEESEVAHGDLSTISFTKMETPAITPNKPVLLKTSTAGTVYNFEGRTIATSEPVVIGTNFDFVGTYASGKIAAGDYFIGSDKLFLSDGSVNVAGTHAYLKAKAAGVKAELFIDGVATAIESIDAETAQPAGAIYNVAGQRVQKAQRGLYIMGGKKVVVK